MSNEEETTRATLWQRPGMSLAKDILAKEMQKRGAQPVRQIALDEVWSALRFRPR